MRVKGLFDSSAKVEAIHNWQVSYVLIDKVISRVSVLLDVFDCIFRPAGQQAHSVISDDLIGMHRLDSQRAACRTLIIVLGYGDQNKSECIQVCESIKKRSDVREYQLDHYFQAQRLGLFALMRIICILTRYPTTANVGHERSANRVLN